MNYSRHLSLIGSLIFLPALLGCPPANPDKNSSTKIAVLRFSAIPNEDVTLLKQKFQPVAAHLSKALGVKVEYVPAIDYAASVDLFKNGDIQLAWFGGFTGVQARHAVKGAEAIACGERDANYKSYFVAHPEAGLVPGESFPLAAKGKKFTFGSKSSTSGRLMPEYFIREETKQAPEEFFGSVSFSGAHDKTIELVASGQIEVGAVDFSVYEGKLARKEFDPKRCVVVWKTPTYADYNFTVRPDVDATFGAGFTKKLQQALVAMKDPELLAGFRRKKIVPCKSADFDGIRDVALKLKMLR